MVGPPIDIVTVFLCYANYTDRFLYFCGVGLPSGAVELKFRAHGAAGPVSDPSTARATSFLVSTGKIGFGELAKPDFTLSLL